MARPVIAAIVEGQGEQLAKHSTLERAVQQQSIRMRGASAGGVLVLLDADDDCPAELGPKLLAWAVAARSDTPVRVVVASREYESWFLAGAASLAGRFGFPEGLEPPKDPDHLPRNAKKWLEEQRDWRPYKETADQLTFSSALDVGLTRSLSDSFDKLCRDVAWLLGSSPRC